MTNTKLLTAFFFLMFVALILFAVLSGCSLFRSEGALQLSITDAPVDADSVAGVYITVTSIEYNRNGEWEQFEDFAGPEKFNLTELTNGNSELIGTLVLPEGQYTQIRFMLDAPNEGGSDSQNPGSYIEFTDSSQSPLFVPSGAQTGYKAEAGEPFIVPANDVVAITVDFDLRKALVERGDTGSYILKPVLRLVVEDQAGSITGGVTYPGAYSLVVFAYENGTYSDTETAESDGSRFPNAVSSDLVENDETGALGYVLSFLAAGTYDLVVAEYDSTTGNYLGVVTTVEDVTVESGGTNTQAISVP